MWNSEMYTPVAIFRNGKLEFNQDVLNDGAGVYLLDFGNNELYVGSTRNIKSRITSHAQSLKASSSVSIMQDAFVSSKAFNAFVLLSLPGASEETLRNAESSMTDLIRPRLNRNRTGHSSLCKSKNWKKSKPINKHPEKHFWVAVNSANGPKVAHFVDLALTMIREEDEANFIKSAQGIVFSYIRKTYAHNHNIMNGLNNLLYLIGKSNKQ